MEIREAGRPGRPKDIEINTTNEGMKDITNDEPDTGQGKTPRTKTRHGHHDDTNESTIQNQQQNSHPAWNPDSRWSA